MIYELYFLISHNPFYRFNYILGALETFYNMSFKVQVG